MKASFTVRLWQKSTNSSYVLNGKRGWLADVIPMFVQLRLTVYSHSKISSGRRSQNTGTTDPELSNQLTSTIQRREMNNFSLARVAREAIWRTPTHGIVRTKLKLRQITFPATKVKGDVDLRVIRIHNALCPMCSFEILQWSKEAGEHYGTKNRALRDTVGVRNFRRLIVFRWLCNIKSVVYWTKMISYCHKKLPYSFKDIS